MRVAAALALLLAAAPVAAQQAPAPAAAAIMATTLNVADLDKALRFYVDGLGMKVNHQMTRPAKRETILGFSADPAQAGIILLDEPKAPRAVTHGTGFVRIVVRMNDLPAVQARLRGLGFTTSEVRTVGMGYRTLMATDADGYGFELVERVPSPPATGGQR